MPGDMNKKSSIAIPEHFSLRECLGFLNRSPLERLHQVRKHAVRKLLFVNDEFVLIEVTQAGRHSLAVDFLTTANSDGVRNTCVDFVRQWFDLERDLAPFYELARNDGILAKLVEAHRGLRLIRIPNLFQAICWAIIGQQVNLHFAYVLHGRLIERFGSYLQHDGELYWAHPEPQVIAGLSVDDLRSLQLTTSKAKFILGVARRMTDGELSISRLQNAANIEMARSQLLNLYGVGPWTANYVLMRCLGYKDAFPVEDVGLHNAIRLALNLKQKPSVAEVRRFGENWTGWRAYATFYLYRSLQ